jgi:hypothetical protein
MINLELLLTCHTNATKHKIPYVWGMKPDIHSDSADIRGSDCSGYIRWLFGRQGIVLPEGSMEQSEYFNNVLKYIHMERYSLTENRNILYLCHAAVTPSHAGHIWLAFNRKTIECYGGHGVGSRDVMHSPLPSYFTNGYVIPYNEASYSSTTL